MTRTRAAATSLSCPPFWIDQRAQIVEAVGCDHARRDQLPKCSLDLCFEFAGAPDNIGEERSTSLLQKIEHELRSVAEPTTILLLALVSRRHPVRLLAHKKRNGRNAGGNDAPLSNRSRNSGRITGILSRAGVV